LHLIRTHGTARTAGDGGRIRKSCCGWQLILLILCKTRATFPGMMPVNGGPSFNSRSFPSCLFQGQATFAPAFLYKKLKPKKNETDHRLASPYSLKINSGKSVIFLLLKLFEHFFVENPRKATTNLFHDEGFTLCTYTLSENLR
jgi:hypothetical protein